MATIVKRKVKKTAYYLFAVIVSIFVIPNIEITKIETITANK